MRAPYENKGIPVPETRLITLDPSNRKSILEKSTNLALERRPEAELILNRLGELNPNLAKQFQYKESTLEKLTLRMICSSNAATAKHPTNTVPSLAISYCWQNDGWKVAKPAHPLTHWGLSLPIVQKILDLKATDEGVWVDQRCIEQNDDEEKNIAIGSMDVIYRAARRLIIALEDTQLNAREEEVGMKYQKMYKKIRLGLGEREPSDGEKSELMAKLFTHQASDFEASNQFILKMLNARWFSRAWCAHESKVNPHGKISNPLFLCFGSDGRVLSFEFRFVRFLATHLQFKYPKTYSPIELQDALDSPTKDNTSIRASNILQNLMPDPRRDDYLLMHLARPAAFDCQEKTDLISIALNFSGIPLTIKDKLDEQRPELRTWVFAMLALASGDLQPLLMWARQLQILDPNKPTEAVSWVDLPHSISPELRISGSPSTLTSIHSVTLEYIELDLYLFTAIPQKASNASLDKACTLIEKCSLLTAGHVAGSQATDSLPLSGPLQVSLMHEKGIDALWLQQLLGCAIDAGLIWIGNLPSILEAHTSSRSWTYGTLTTSSPGSEFKPAALQLLSSCFNLTPTFVKDNLALVPEGHNPDTFFEETLLSPVIKFLTCITDYRLRFPAKVPRLIQTHAQGEQPTDFADFGFTELTSDRSYVAVPVALAHLPFWENKAWMIEPGDTPYVPDWTWKERDKSRGKVHAREVWPVLTADMGDRRAERNEETWNLRCRQALVGCNKIVPDGKACILLRKQKVYGGRDYDWEGMKRMKEGWPKDYKDYIL